MWAFTSPGHSEDISFRAACVNFSKIEQHVLDIMKPEKIKIKTCVREREQRRLG
jgi:hypothetical protein